MKVLDKEMLKSNIEKIAMLDLTNNNLFGSSYFVYQNGKVILTEKMLHILKKRHIAKKTILMLLLTDAMTTRHHSISH